ncbi:tRNA pseudouridine synthase D [Trichoderma citrinoviride]|uniref:tRNA pseudouridine synthase D n=1 Tax=Trichoderma citrinoviride TaxID=58853 RepID=A0A2T4BD91_9HYPO|nr:tRNA pseudouridine synthase D [Trichoderma citrinoviride]PTB67297.1 tRNA pseudouridine synthase D [Trichoderma citrinoviride]
MSEQAHYNVRQSASHAKSIGITQRATPLRFPWVGDLRVRFSDFQVNEIGKDGAVVHLRKIGLNGQEKQTTDAAPAQEVDTSKQQQDSAGKADANDANGAKDAPQEKEIIEIPAEDVTALSNLAGEKFAQELVDLFREGQVDASEKKKPVVSEPVDDKFKRGEIHQEIRRIFNSRIETSTDDAGAIVASYAAPTRRGKRGRGGRNRNRNKQDDQPIGEYLHFTLFKDNRDTMDAVNQIARILKVKPQVINYAGTKDRRASTVQRCSVRYTRDRSLAGINGKLWGITTGDYEYKAEPIHLGELLGNEFVITIKNCQIVGEACTKPISEQVELMRANVQSALDHMTEHGWINYFGHQRFGTHQIGTHEIGKLILGENYEAAINAILAYDEEIARKAETEGIPDEPAKRDEYNRHLACMLFKTEKDVDKAIEIMPRRFSAEVCVLRHLNRQGKQSRRDFVGALIHITRGLRSMYLHACQSHVWNHAASRRWELHGEKVVKGDLVIAETEATPQISGQDQDGDDIVNPVEDDDDVPLRARPLTEEEAASGRYTIHDVVLPTPGYDVIYPDNEIGDFYVEFMGREENGGLDPHKMRRMRREFSLPGRYRKLMNKFLGTPAVEFKTYVSDEEQMHPTDLDLIRAARKASGNDNSTNSNNNNKRSREEGDDARPSKVAKVEQEDQQESDAGTQTKETNNDAADNENKADEPATEATTGANAEAMEVDQQQPLKIAAVIKFQLGRSAYATVTLRELMGDPPESSNTA